MKTKYIIFMLIMFSVASCLKIPDEESRKEIIIPDENFETNTQNISVPFAVSINFINGQAEVNNPFENYGVTVNIEKQNVTIISTTMDMEVNYVLSGNTSNGFVKIYSDLRFGLILNGVSILNPTGAAINIQSGNRISVMLVDHTSNRLIDGGSFQMTAGEDMKATFFSEGQLIFNGAGSLLVYGNYGHAICSDDYIRINNGNITVNNATSDGIHCNDYFEMNGGKLVVNAKSDGVDCAKGYITINNGEIQIYSGNKGLKSIENLTISGGRTEIESLEEGIRAEGNIVVTGGEIFCYGRAGLMSRNGAIAITGGLLLTSGTRNAFDCAKTFSITGGTVIGVGRATTIPNESASRQRTIVWGATRFTKGQLIYIKSSHNAEVLTCKLPRAYSEDMALVYSSPLLQANTGYTIFKGGTLTGGSDFHGLYSGAVSNGGTTAATLNTSSIVTIVGNVVSQ